MTSHQALALLGGPKTVEKPFSKYNTMGTAEKEAAIKVIESGNLSAFIARHGEYFNGGENVKGFERECETFFNVKHAITVNSWTSGLIVAVGAIDIEPGDEIIVSPWTMSASATAILHWNAIPVFADIEENTFCLDPKSIEANITPYTKAIMVVDIFGQSANMLEIMEIAKRYNLKVISDTAQAPGAIYNGRHAGTIGDIGGFSLNYHKHIHTGEGGVIVTNDDGLAEKCRLIRNHAEAILEDRPEADLTNMVGYNFRLGEIECAIGREQLKKLPSLIKKRQDAAVRLNEGLKNLKGLQIPRVEPNSTHVYYVYSMILDIKKLGVKKEKIAEALRAEGMAAISTKYVNVHQLPIFQNKIAYGSKGFPWTADFCKRDVSYEKGICPVAEYLQETSYLGFGMCQFDLDDQDLENIIAAFQKVWANLDKLK